MATSFGFRISSFFDIHQSVHQCRVNLRAFLGANVRKRPQLFLCKEAFPEPLPSDKACAALRNQVVPQFDSDWNRGEGVFGEIMGGHGAQFSTNSAAVTAGCLFDRLADFHSRVRRFAGRGPTDKRRNIAVDWHVAIRLVRAVYFSLLIRQMSEVRQALFRKLASAGVAILQPMYRKMYELQGVDLAR